MRGPWVLTGVVLLCALALAALLMPYYKPHTKTIEVGLQGEARLNRFLAMQRFLEGSEMAVQSKRKVTPFRSLENFDTLIVPLESFPDSPKLEKQLATWVRQGGILITGISSRTPVQHEWPKYWLKLFGLRNLKPYESVVLDEVEEVELETEFDEDNLEDLEVTDEELEAFIEETSGSDRDERLEPFQTIVLEGEKFKVSDFQKYEMLSRNSNNIEIYSNELEEVWLSAKWYGDGGILFFANLEIFENDWIGEHEHAKVLDYLERNYLGYNTAIIYHSHSLSLLKALWDHIPYTVIGFMILIGSVCWHTFYRFGPFLNRTTQEERRSLKEHLEASAFFYQRQNVKDKEEAQASEPSPPNKTEKS